MKPTICFAFAVGLLMCNIQGAHGLTFSVPASLIQRSQLFATASMQFDPKTGRIMCGEQCFSFGGIASCTGPCKKKELEVIARLFPFLFPKDSKSSTVPSIEPSTVQPEPEDT